MSFRMLLGSLEELLFILRVLLREVSTQWMLGLWIVDECCQCLYDLVSLSGRLPVLRGDDGKTHLSLLVNVGVVYFRFERYLGRLERVLCGEVNVDAESPFVVGRLFCADETFPVEDVGLVNLDIAKHLLIRCSNVVEFFGQSSSRSHGDEVGRNLISIVS